MVLMADSYESIALGVSADACERPMAGGYGGMTLGLDFNAYWIVQAMEEWDLGAGRDDDGETKTNKP